MVRRPRRDEWDDDWDDDSEPFDGDDDGGDDDGDTVECPACGREIYDDAERCPHCGEYLTEADRLGRGKPVWVVLTVAIVLAAILLTWIF